MDVRFFKADSRVVIVFDYKFYAEREEEIDEWCWQAFDYHPREGLVLTFRNESDTNMFLLRWS